MVTIVPGHNAVTVRAGAGAACIVTIMGAGVSISGNGDQEDQEEALKSINNSDLPQAQ